MLKQNLDELQVTCTRCSSSSSSSSNRNSAVVNLQAVLAAAQQADEAQPD
jgi:hypothetical protein